MRHRTADGTPARLALQEIASRYDSEWARVDAARRRMREAAAGSHVPADTRAAAEQLTVALRGATTTVTRALHLLEPAPPARHRCRPRRKATRSLPPAASAWSAELVHLTQIDVWLRRAVLDELGVHVPTVVRVRDGAATGPHIAGMVAEPENSAADTQGEALIGVNLQAIVDGDGVSRTPAAVATLPVTLPIPPATPAAPAAA